MNPDTIRQYCDEIDARTQAIRDELRTPPAPVAERVVTDAAELQAALDAGGRVALAADLSCTTGGGYTCGTAATVLRGLGGNVVGASTGPALAVPVGVDVIGIESLAVVTGFDVAVRVGQNDAGQTTVAQAPHGVQLRGLASQGHRGKRAIEINAADVAVVDCDVRDLYAPSKADSQAIWIGNAPGPVRVERGYFEAASENLMVGGDTMKIPDCRPTSITVRLCTFRKPLAWQGNAAIPVKNLLELKDGEDVVIDACDFAQCWASAQDGYCFMFTPSNGGSVSVVVRDCRVADVGGIMNITGTDATGVNSRRTRVELYGGEYRTNKAARGGSGRFSLITRGPERVIVDGALVRHDGASFIDVGDSAPVDVLRITGCDWNYGSYGLRIGGANHGDNSQGQIGELVITGNTITGAHAHFRDRYPDNLYVSSMMPERERDVDRRAKDHARDVDAEVRRVWQWDREYRL